MDHDEWFSAFYRAHYAAVLRYTLRRTDRETAHDVVSETFLVAWRSARLWQPTRAAGAVAVRRRPADAGERRAV